VREATGGNYGQLYAYDRYLKILNAEGGPAGWFAELLWKPQRRRARRARSAFFRAILNS
jgi:hypothetical protein